MGFQQTTNVCWCEGSTTLLIPRMLAVLAVVVKMSWKNTPSGHLEADYDILVLVEDHFIGSLSLGIFPGWCSQLVGGIHYQHPPLADGKANHQAVQNSQNMFVATSSFRLNPKMLPE